MQLCDPLSQASPGSNFKEIAGQTASSYGVCKLKHELVLECYKATQPKEK